MKKKSKLKELRLSGRQLKDSDSASLCKGEVCLAFLSGNFFSVVPSSIMSSSLRVLDLSHNRVRVVQDDLATACPNLERLFLQNNLIVTVRCFASSMYCSHALGFVQLPANLLKCELLTQLDLCDNPLLISKDLAKAFHSRIAVRACLEQLNDPNCADKIVKLKLKHPADLASVRNASKGKWPNSFEATVNLKGQKGEIGVSCQVLQKKTQKGMIGLWTL